MQIQYCVNFTAVVWLWLVVMSLCPRTEADDSKLKVQTILTQAIKDGDFPKVRKLLQSANPNEPDENDKHPIRVAIDQRDIRITELLIKRGVHLNTALQHGWTPLLGAALASKNRAELVKLLVSNGADVNLSNEEGVTPLYVIVSNKPSPETQQLVTLLLEEGADVNASRKGFSVLHKAVESSGDDGAVVKLLLRKQPELNSAETASRFTPLHVAAHRGYQKVILTLLDAGADSKVVDDKGRKPVDIAKERNHTECVTVLENTAKLKKEER